MVEMSIYILLAGQEATTLTCIVGLETETGIIIGGDSAAANGWDIHASRLKKVFKQGEFLIGYTSSFRMGQLLQYKLSVEQQKNEQSDLEYLATTFIDAVRECLKEGGFRTVENEQESGGQFLVGYKGKLYAVDSDFQVNSSVDGFMAVGCGASFALGSMWSNQNLSPKKRVKKALKAAGHFSNGVCGPYRVMSC